MVAAEHFYDLQRLLFLGSATSCISSPLTVCYTPDLENCFAHHFGERCCFADEKWSQNDAENRRLGAIFLPGATSFIFILYPILSQTSQTNRCVKNL